MTQVILENAHGVQIREGDKYGPHYRTWNALCECGEGLIVAPRIYHPKHEKGNPVMVCRDFGVHAYRFRDLVQGRQPKALPHNTV